MPALVNSNVGSLAGRSGLERKRVWPCRSKYCKNFARISLPVIEVLQVYLSEFSMRNVTRRTQCVPEIEAIGLAMLMRGKSLTCRKKLIKYMAVYDRGSETPEMRNFCDGKSKTCRAS